MLKFGTQERSKKSAGGERLRKQRCSPWKRNNLHIHETILIFDQILAACFMDILKHIREQRIFIF